MTSNKSTLSIMIFSITTLSTLDLIVTLSTLYLIVTLTIKEIQHN
jgi:hypothetical protein